MQIIPDTQRISPPRLRALLAAVLGGFVLASAAHAGTSTNTTSFEYDPVTVWRTSLPS
jgi:hypothetical protein